MKATVTVYSSPKCGPCQALKKHLVRIGIDYESIDITNPPEDSFFSVRSIPTTVVKKGKKSVEIIGYSTSTIEDIKAAMGEDK